MSHFIERTPERRSVEVSEPGRRPPVVLTVPPLPPDEGIPITAPGGGYPRTPANGWWERVVRWLVAAFGGWTLVRCPECRSTDSIAWVPGQTWAQRIVSPMVHECQVCGRQWLTRCYWDDGHPW